MRRRWIWPVLLTALLVAGIGVGRWGYNEYQDKKRMETVLGNKYQYNFYGLLSKVENIETILAKGLVSSTQKQRTSLFSDLLYQSYSGQEHLGQMPIDHVALTRTSRFLNQIGDYAWSLNRKLAEGGKLTPSDYNNLQELHERSILLNQNLHKVEAKVSDGTITWSEMKQKTNDSLEKSSKALNTNMTNVVKELTELPTLIYDGPFSEHVTKMKPLGLWGPNVTREQARTRAKGIIDAQNAKSWSSKFLANSNGKIPSYNFELRPPNDKNRLAYVNVTKKGGHVVFMLDTRPITSKKITLDKAKNKAYNFLATRGLKKMISTFMIERNNIAVISFIRLEKNVAIYPDQVKVQVAMDNGEIVGFESSMYLLYHTEKRRIPKPVITLAQARKIISPKVNVSSRRLAIIPTEGKKELLCWEFVADLGNDTFFIYINAKTGVEERILKLIKLPNGTLTM
jgi:spore germination protein